MNSWKDPGNETSLSPTQDALVIAIDFALASLPSEPHSNFGTYYRNSMQFYSMIKDWLHGKGSHIDQTPSHKTFKNMGRPGYKGNTLLCSKSVHKLHLKY